MQSMDRISILPDYDIPRIICGGWQLSTGHALKQALDMADAKRAFETLLEHGFNTFDGADIYTGVEDFYGRIIRERRALGLSIPQIHTKFVPDLKDLEHVDYGYVERIILRSLDRLGLDRLDMVQFHWWDYAKPGMIDTARHLARLQAAGKIHVLSTTNFNAAELEKILDAGISIATVQCQYSLLDRRPQKAMADLCRRRGVRMIAYGTLAGGFLSEKWIGAPKPDIGKLENRSLVKYLLVIEDTLGWSGYQALLEKLRRLSAELQLSISDIATLYVLAQPGVAAAVVGTRSSRHIADTLKLAGRALPAEALKELDAFVADFPMIEGDCFDAERLPGGKHRAIMRMNLVDSDTGFDA